jgi:hypothetical protein
VPPDSPAPVPLGDPPWPAGPDPGAPEEASPTPPRSLRHTLLAALVTTLVITTLSYLVPSRHASTAVGLAFVAATWWLVLRHDEDVIRAHGLSLAGVLEPLPLEPKRILREAGQSLLWVLFFAAVVFPPFWLGYRLFWNVHTPFVLRAPREPLNELVGQFFVIALPEEAFFRGYLQSALDATWKPRWRVLGAWLGPGLLVSSLIFAVGHVLTTPSPARLAVFFPALVFGWMRARTGGIGASVVFHALCNIFSATLARGYGLGP